MRAAMLLCTILRRPPAPYQEGSVSNFYVSLAPAQLQQDINPWTWVNPFAHSQIGWINVNLGKSSDPALERRILDDVGSYGRQIGQLGDALEAVLNHLPVAEWKP
jgi:hypothetical protein